jgi:hypothetical protein
MVYPPEWRFDGINVHESNECRHYRLVMGLKRVWGASGPSSLGGGNPSNNLLDTKANTFVNYAAGTVAGYMTKGTYATAGINGVGKTNIQNGASRPADSSPLGITSSAAIPA